MVHDSALSSICFFPETASEWLFVEQDERTVICFAEFDDFIIFVEFRMKKD